MSEGGRLADCLRSTPRVSLSADPHRPAHRGQRRRIGAYA